MTLPSLKLESLEATCSTSGSTLIAVLTGAAELSVQDALNDFMVQLHAAAQAQKAEVVDVDLKALRFMSSSCFKVFITWLTSLNDAKAPVYRVRFISDSTMYWQRRSLTALAAFGGDRVEVLA